MYQTPGRLGKPVLSGGNRFPMPRAPPEGSGIGPLLANEAGPSVSQGGEAGVGKVIVAIVLCAACAQSNVGQPPPPVSGNVGPDAGTPPGNIDAGNPPDAGQPPPPPPDAGTPPDGDTPDAGPKFGGPGPWPMTNEIYGAAQGIMESPVVGVSTDEAQNLWVATHEALYLMKPGDSKFTRFDGNAGLHLPGFDEKSCDDVTGNPITPCISPSSAASPGISEIVGGASNEVFVGYYGFHDWNNPNDSNSSDPYRHSGMLDRVRLKSDGTIEVVRFTMVSGDSTFFWHNRVIERMVYDHFLHPHELYVGTDHGVDKFSPDLWSPLPIPHTYDDWKMHNLVWMSDHLHPQACYHHPCVDETDLRLGDWRGLAIDPSGDLWVAGRWAAGEIIYTPDNAVWFNRGGKSFKIAWGDYYTYCNDNRPIFCIPQEGDYVNLSAVTVGHDGRVWWSSGIIYGDAGDVNYGVAVWDPVAKHFSYFDPMNDIGMAESNVRDMVALPNGNLVLAGPTTGLVVWDPITRKHASIRAGNGIPSDEVHRLELDTMVDPPALHVATAGGAAVLRQIPVP